MFRIKHLLLPFFLLALSAFTYTACKHDNVLTGVVQVQSDSVSYLYQVQPLLSSACGSKGCHGSGSSKSNYNVDTYANTVPSLFKPYNWVDSKGQRAINGIDQMMPPDNHEPLTSQQKNLLSQWVSEGARNTTNTPAGLCDTTNVTYTTHIAGLMQQYCTGCHGNAQQSGGINLASYADVKTQGLNGQLIGTITHDPNSSIMPPNGIKLGNCQIREVQLWIAANCPQ